MESSATRVPELRYVYLIVDKDHPSRSLCSGDVSEHPVASLANKRDRVTIIHQGLQLVDKEDLGAYAIITAGGVYSIKGDLLKNSDKGWFNIACANDALAQTELQGIARADRGSQASEPERRAALRMLTARYRDGETETTYGIPIKWKKGREASYPPPEKDNKGEVPEAQWNEHGATCLSHSRLWTENVTVVDVQGGFKAFEEKDLLARYRPGLMPCGSIDPEDTKLPLTSFTVDHYDPPRPTP